MGDSTELKTKNIVGPEPACCTFFMTVSLASIDTCPHCLDYPLEDTETVGSTHLSWLQCEICRQWFHTKCLDMTNSDISSLKSYHCIKCRVLHGPSVLRRKSKRQKTLIDYVALNSGDLFAVDKSAHPHVSLFLTYPVAASADSTLGLIEVSDDMDQALKRRRVHKPILVPEADFARIGMRLASPREQLSVDFITSKVGADHPIEVMDVLSQQGVQPGWNMQKWCDYFCGDTSARDRIRNVISLEVSEVDGVGKQFRRPQLVCEMDLADKVWEYCVSRETELAANSKRKTSPRPAVTKYCLMSVENSFTDFHIDFGGTLVYYTVISGAKSFLMFPPTIANLQIYQNWCLESNQNYMWLPDYKTRVAGGRGKLELLEGGFKVSLSAGDVFMIPSGWIHAVYTPSDSVVIGGNYLTLTDMKVQLQIARVERATNVPTKYRFPMFNKLLWFTSWYYLKHPDEFLTDLGCDVSSNSQHYNTTVNGTEPQLCIEVPSSDEITSEQREHHAKSILECLIEHLSWHHVLSQTNNAARKSIPLQLIGNNVTEHIARLRNWLDTM